MKYYGCGQKSGFALNKDGAAMTFFNYDNYAYDPNTPSLPLYISVPLLLEVCAPPAQQPDPLVQLCTSLRCFTCQLARHFGSCAAWSACLQRCAYVGAGATAVHR